MFGKSRARKEAELAERVASARARVAETIPSGQPKLALLRSRLVGNGPKDSLRRWESAHREWQANVRAFEAAADELLALAPNDRKAQTMVKKGRALIVAHDKMWKAVAEPWQNAPPSTRGRRMTPGDLPAHDWLGEAGPG